jgi:hypothetical protein
VTTGQQDFHGLDFEWEPGEVYGARSWTMRDGLLRPRFRGQDVWTPGVNTAACLAVTVPADERPELVIDPTGRGRAAQAVRLVYVDHGPFKRSRATWDVLWDDGERSTHDWLDMRQRPHGPVPDESCQCGFYAYNRLEYAEQDSIRYVLILGIIRGFGRTLIGDRGFRCEKAEIVALLDPNRYGLNAFRERQAEQIRRNYPDVPILGSATELAGFASLGMAS